MRSDTLFSAWVSSYARLFGAAGIESLLHQCLTSPEPPFRISSSFVYRHTETGFIDYLPAPIHRPPGYPSHPESERAIAKTYKKLAYLPTTIWQRWYQGTGFDNDEDQLALINYAKDPEHKTGELGRSGAFDYSNAFVQYELPKVSAL